MRLKQLYTILLLCCVNICFAQNKLFDKYADMDDVTSVYISKKMFQMMPVMETAGLNLANLKGKIESLQILTTQKADLRERMRGEFKALIGKDHEELHASKRWKDQSQFLRQATRRTDTGVDHDSRHGRRELQRHAIVRAFYAPRCARNYQ